MNNLRYTQILKPMDAYFAKLTPNAQRFVHMLEGGLVVVLLSSMIFYV